VTAALVPLLERIYETGKVETDHGDLRSAEPVGVPRRHAVQLAELVRERELYSTLETGMAYGLSTLAIAGVHLGRGAGQHIAIDPAAAGYYEGIGLANLRRAGLDGCVRLVAAGSQLALPRLVEEGVRLDFAFIDGMHLFDYALIDFFYVDQMLTAGGYVAFHDTWMPAVQDVVDFVVANRQYEPVPGVDGGLAVLRKRQADRRAWNHYRPFARPRPVARSIEEEARELLGQLRERAEQAADRAGGFRQHDFVLSGDQVRMRFAGDSLEPAMLPAFAHARASASDQPDLEILIWDNASSGVPDPSVPWDLGDVRARGDVRGYEDMPISVFSEPASGSITVFDKDRATIVYWVVDARAVPWHERGAPLRSALHQWAAGSGRHFVHGGAVGSGEAGILLAGPSGSGKSTTALACLEAGLDYAGDDYVILTGGDAPRAHCLYSTAKLDAAALERLPGLSAAVVEFRRGDEHKAVLDLHRYRPHLLRSSLPVSAIVLPSLGQGERPALRRASGAEALRALAPTTVLQLPGAAHARMKAMADLVRRVPVFGLELGADVTAVPDLIARICADPDVGLGLGTGTDQDRS
jgi:predicted O-methyltransferase YrrM